MSHSSFVHISVGVEDEDDQRMYEAELERQIDDLKVKLFYKENELDQRGSHQRLTRLLEEIRGKIEQVEQEKVILQQQIQYYHQRLLCVDVENEKKHDPTSPLFAKGVGLTLNSMRDMNLHDSPGGLRKSMNMNDYTDREKMMQAALKQSLSEKDNAMRLLIKLLGKETVQDVMKHYEPPKRRNRSPISPWTSSGSQRAFSLSPHRNSDDSTFLPADVTLSERERYYDYLLDALTNPSKHVSAKKSNNNNKDKILTPHAKSFISANTSPASPYSSPISPTMSHSKEKNELDQLLGLTRSSERKYLKSASSTVDKYGNPKKNPPSKLTESDIMAALRFSP